MPWSRIISIVLAFIAIPVFLRLGCDQQEQAMRFYNQDKDNELSQMEGGDGEQYFLEPYEQTIVRARQNVRELRRDIRALQDRNAYLRTRLGWGAANPRVLTEIREWYAENRLGLPENQTVEELVEVMASRIRELEAEYRELRFTTLKAKDLERHTILERRHEYWRQKTGEIHQRDIANQRKHHEHREAREQWRVEQEAARQEIFEKQRILPRLRRAFARERLRLQAQKAFWLEKQRKAHERHERKQAREYGIDGMVLEANRATMDGSINLGRRHGVTEGLTFRVVSYSHGGRQIPRGACQIMRVMDYSSEVRFWAVPNMLEFIKPGDFIFNDTFEMTEQIRFSLVGDFEGLTPFARDELDLILRLHGHEVDDEVTDDTDIICLGRPPTDQRELQYYNEQIDAARNRYTEFLSGKKLLTRIGFYNDPEAFWREEWYRWVRQGRARLTGM